MSHDLSEIQLLTFNMKAGQMKKEDRKPISKHHGFTFNGNKGIDASQLAEVGLTLGIDIF